MNNGMSVAALNNVVTLPSAEKALLHLGRLEIEIENAPSLEEVDAIARTAAAYQHAFRPVKEVADRAGTVQALAMRKIGTELAKLPKAKGNAGPGRGKAGSKAGPAFNDAPTLKDLGVSKKRAAKAKKLADMATDKINDIVEGLIENGRSVTPESILAADRAEKKDEKKATLLAAVFSATGPFDVVVTDPPWPMQKIDREERPNQDAFDYGVMSLEEIEAHWRREIEPRTKPDCHVLWWTTQRYLPPALQMVERLGYRYVFTMVWHKAGGFQPIDLPQYNAEFIIYARKGAPLFIDTKDFKVCNAWPRREHSRKPFGFYELIKRVTGGSRVDVFSREPHEGFAQYGDEISKFRESA
jgi:N6-adenosine-specific RNA methylase IME4